MSKTLIVLLAGLALLATACGSSTDSGSDAVLFSDDFSAANGAWDVLEQDPEILLEYDQGAYRMTALAEAMVFSSVPQVQLPADVSIEVDLVQTAGTLDTAMGIICRNSYSDQGNSMYFFMITQDGTAKIAKYVYSQKTLLAGDNQILPEIHTDGSVNRLRADCVGDQLSMYVNGTLLLSVSDDSLADGDAGLMMGTADELDAVVRFDNFVVRQP